MSRRLLIIARVAVFAALVFIFSYFSVFLQNVNPGFFLVFAAGFAWGIMPGIGVGIIGFFLWSNFNPYGPAPFPILISQMVGITFSALIGTSARHWLFLKTASFTSIVFLALAGFLCGLFYHIVVDVVDAWVYQPFWPRLIAGLTFSLITMVSNAIIFPILKPVLVFLVERDKVRKTV